MIYLSKFYPLTFSVFLMYKYSIRQTYFGYKSAKFFTVSSFLLYGIHLILQLASARKLALRFVKRKPLSIHPLLKKR